jgi:hypothetical protein
MCRPLEALFIMRWQLWQILKLCTIHQAWDACNKWMLHIIQWVLCIHVELTLLDKLSRQLPRMANGVTDAQCHWQVLRCTLCKYSETEMDIWNSIPARAEILFSLPLCSYWLWYSHNLLSMVITGSLSLGIQKLKSKTDYSLLSRTVV